MTGNVVPACKTCNASKNGSIPGPWVERAMLADYSSDPMENVTSLAISWGNASPEDFMTPEIILEYHPGITAEEWIAVTIVPVPVPYPF